MIQIQPAEGIQLPPRNQSARRRHAAAHDRSRFQFSEGIPQRHSRRLSAAAARHAAKATPACSPGPTRSKPPGRSSIRFRPPGWNAANRSWPFTSPASGGPKNRASGWPRAAATGSTSARCWRIENMTERRGGPARRRLRGWRPAGVGATPLFRRQIGHFPPAACSRPAKRIKQELSAPLLPFLT